MEKISSEDSSGSSFNNSLYDTQSFSEEDTQGEHKSIVGNQQEIQDRTEEEIEEEIHQVIWEQEQEPLSSNLSPPSTHSQQAIEELEEDNYGSATPPSDPITATAQPTSAAVEDPTSTTSDAQVDNHIINNNNLDLQSEETDTETCNSSPLLGSVNLLYPQSSPKLRFRKLASKSHLQEKSNHFNPNPTSFDNSDLLNNNMNSIPLTNSRRGYLPIGGTAASQSQSFGYSLFAWAARKRVLVVILIVGVIIGGQVFLLGPSLVGEEKLRQWGLEGEFWLVLPCGRN